ncbi:MAG: UPF0175 family protein [Candidatus Poribacteria bacterium]|nr:UPF0175 family protein [Candidatus Poribacteria bacterium]
MSLLIPDEVVRATEMTEDELRLEFACFLYLQEKLALSKAARFVGMPRIDFQMELAKRKIHINYSVEDLERDLETLDRVFQK